VAILFELVQRVYICMEEVKISSGRYSDDS
jgi:hypothetical protein